MSNKKKQSKATLGLIMGIVSLFTAIIPVIGIIIATIAMIISLKGLKEKTRKNQAIAGMAMGGLSLLVCLFMTITIWSMTDEEFDKIASEEDSVQVEEKNEKTAEKPKQTTEKTIEITYEIVEEGKKGHYRIQTNAYTEKEFKALGETLHKDFEDSYYNDHLEAAYFFVHENDEVGIYGSYKGKVWIAYTNKGRAMTNVEKGEDYHVEIDPDFEKSERTNKKTDKKEVKEPKKITWKKEIKEIASSELTESEKFDKVMIMAKKHKTTEKEVMVFARDILDEYLDENYLSDIRNDEYMLTNIFKSHMIDSYFDDKDKVPLDKFAFDFFQNSKYTYRGIDAVRSEAVKENEAQMDKMINIGIEKYQNSTK